QLFIIGLVWLNSSAALAQDGKMYPMDAPKEEGAIPLGTGGVKDQPAKESWFRQWGDPMARNITTATLTPFLADPAKANGTSVIVAPGGGVQIGRATCRERGKPVVVQRPAIRH